MVAVSGRGWNLAPCLVALIEEADRLFPNRSTVSDGSIGDTAHASRASDHNPADGWVCAVDVTDDKANGCDADLLAQHIVAGRDPRVKYVIWNRTIAKSYASNGIAAWTPQPYTGTNAHEKHTHISVHNTATARGDTSSWWPQDEEIDMAAKDEILKAIADMRQELGLRAIELDDDIPENVQDQLGEIRRNLRTVAAKVGVPADQIET